MSRRPQLGIRARAALALGAVLAVGVTGTFAYWSDSVPVSGVTITTGTLDLKVDGADSVTTYTDLSLTNMAPGNTTAGVLTVKNNGTIPLTYHLDSATTPDPSSTGTGDLAAALTVRITTAATVSGSGSSRTCGGTAIAGSGTSFGTALIPAADARPLAAGATETLCIQAGLSDDAPSALQGAGIDVSFIFTADQVRS